MPTQRHAWMAQCSSNVSNAFSSAWQTVIMQWGWCWEHAWFIAHSTTLLPPQPTARQHGTATTSDTRMGDRTLPWRPTTKTAFLDCLSLIAQYTTESAQLVRYIRHYTLSFHPQINKGCNVSSDSSQSVDQEGITSTVWISLSGSVIKV